MREKPGDGRLLASEGAAEDSACWKANESRGQAGTAYQWDATKSSGSRARLWFGRHKERQCVPETLDASRTSEDSKAEQMAIKGRLSKRSRASCSWQ